MEVECIGVVKSGKGLSSVLKNFCSFVPLYHPHFVGGTYLACNKTRTVAILQSMDMRTSQVQYAQNNRKNNDNNNNNNIYIYIYIYDYIMKLYI